MSLKNRYLVASDLDGTLLNSSSRLSKSTIDFVRSFQADGNIFTISTGRPFQGAIGYAIELGVRIMVCDNGGTIYFLDNNKGIEYNINKYLFLDYVKEIRANLVGAFSSNYYNICIDNDNIVPGWCKHIDMSRRVYYGRIEEILNHNPINPCLFIKSESLEYCLNILKKDKYSSLGYRYWEYNDLINLELFNKRGTKGEALEELLMLLDIDPDKALAFGDTLNDLELILKAKNGVAIKNATAELKRESKYITEYDNDNDGVIRFISHFIMEH